MFDDDVPVGYTLYKVQNCITREYRKVIARNRDEAISKANWLSNEVKWVLPLFINTPKPPKEKKEDSDDKHKSIHEPPKGTTLAGEIGRLKGTREQMIPLIEKIVSRRAKEINKHLSKEQVQIMAKRYYYRFRTKK